MIKDNFQKAQEIKEKVKEYTKTIVKEGTDLYDLANKIEDKIISLGGKIAFPTSLAVNEIAAHHNPQKGEKAEGVLKIDSGILYKDVIIDSAFSIDLTKDKKYKKLIEASEKALEEIREMVKEGTKVNEIGKKIQETITEKGFSPIRNLSGHSIELDSIHAGVTIPNYDNGNKQELGKGLFAVEPFATTGEGVVKDGKPSGIFNLLERKAIRDNLARKILDFIEENFSTRPFCDRWIINKFGDRAKFSLKLMKQQGILHEYAVLIEKSKMPVSHAEDTFLIE